MTWYFNFCAPTIPNDSTISFHRGFQTAQLMTLMILFVLYHTYYKIWGPDPFTDSQDQNESNENQSRNQSELSKNQSNNSNQKSPNQQSKSNSFDNKSVSIAQKIKDIDQQNESYVSLKRSGEKFLKKQTFKQTQTTRNPKKLNVKENVTVQEIEFYFPIVFGHHAIAMGASIMYSPYAQQSIAAVLYVLFTFILAIANSKRLKRTTYAVWIFMAFLNVFIMMSALLQVGQSNWDYINNMCFAEQYTSLY